MKLTLRRVILFSRDLEAMTRFYHDLLGLEVREGSPREGWVDFGPLALHRGKGRAGNCKITFYSGEVARDRAALLARGVKLSAVKKFGALAFCDGRDPEGNRIQLSSRR